MVHFTCMLDLKKYVEDDLGRVIRVDAVEFGASPAERASSPYFQHPRAQYPAPAPGSGPAPTAPAPQGGGGGGVSSSVSRAPRPSTFPIVMTSGRHDPAGDGGISFASALVACVACVSRLHAAARSPLSSVRKLYPAKPRAAPVAGLIHGRLGPEDTCVVDEYPAERSPETVALPGTCDTPQHTCGIEDCPMDETSRSGGGGGGSHESEEDSQNGYDDDDGMVEILARPRVYYPRWKIVRQQELYPPREHRKYFMLFIPNVILYLQTACVYIEMTLVAWARRPPSSPERN